MDNYNDAMNLKDFVEQLTNYIREKNGSSDAPKNIVSFFSLILTGEDTRKESLVSMMQRLLSGNISYEAKTVKALANEIVSGKRDDSLLRHLAVVSQAIEGCPNGDSFFETLYSQCSFRFFSREELQMLRSCLQKKDNNHSKLLLLLVKHGFETLQNIPCFFAQRMYSEALTCDWDSPHRHALMKIAAEYGGHKEAALEYANYLARRYGQTSDADEYFMRALPKKEAIWSLANRIEIRWISQDRVPAFRAALKVEDKIAGPEFEAYRWELEGITYGGSDPDREESMLFLYRVYFYLAYEDFFKGFHSMAKQLETGMIRFSGPDGEAKAIKLRDKYRAAANKASCVISILSEGNSILQHYLETGKFVHGTVDEQNMLALLKLAADTDLLYAYFHLGEFYENLSRKGLAPQENREAARGYFLRAEQLDSNGDGRGGLLWLKLGLVSDSREERQNYLEKALEARQWDAAFYLAEMWSEQCLSGGKAALLHLLHAEKILTEYLPLISEQNREQATLLQRALVTAIEHEEIL